MDTTPLPDAPTPAADQLSQALDTSLASFSNSIGQGDSLSIAALAFIAAAAAYMLFVSSFFEHALFTLSRDDLSRLIGCDDAPSKRVKKMLKRAQPTMASLVAAQFVASAMLIACTAVAAMALMQWSLWPTALKTVVAMLASLLSVTLVAELAPTATRQNNRLDLLCSLSAQASCFEALLAPMAGLLQLTKIPANRIEVKMQHHISLDELNDTLKTERVQSGVEKDILQGIVNFGSICVDEIMRPRVDIVDIDINSSYGKVLETIQESEYSRLPVYEDSIDNIKGILYVKDLLSHTSKDDDFEWQKLIRKPYFVPESKKIDELLKEFQSKHIHMAIVVDEFGGTSGIATLENILEVIVGDISDEHDQEQQLFTKIDNSNFVIEGKLPLNDFYKLGGVAKDDFAKYDGDCDTLAGLLLTLKGDIPKMGDKIDLGHYHFQIMAADNRRIKKIRLMLQSADD